MALHLPVAPRCNVQCFFCDRGGDCTQHSPPGSASVLLTPQQAVTYAREALALEPRISSFGVTGPGDPLANASATLRTLQSLRAAQPAMPLFIATNGLALAENAARLAQVGVNLVMVTVNAIDAEVGARLVDWVQGPEGIVAGVEAAALLRERQLAGIVALHALGVPVQVNFLLFSGVNGSEVEPVARAAAAAGARYFHVQPFVPSAGLPPRLAEVPVASREQVDGAYELASRHLETVREDRLGGAASLGCFDRHGTPTMRSLLEETSRQPDTPSSAVAASHQEPTPEPGERTVALRQLRLIARVAKWLATSDEGPEATLRRVLVWLDEQLGLRRAVIALADPAGDSLHAIVTHGYDLEQSARVQYRTAEGVNGRVFATGQSALLPSLAADPSFADLSGARAGLDLTRLAYLCVAIRDRGTILGTLSADRDNSALKDADSDLRMLEEVGQLIAPFVQRWRLENNLELFQRLRWAEGPFARLVGRSPAMDEVRRLIAKVAPTNTTVMVTGETGTGKSAAAELVHALSPRAAGPFVELNCGAIPPNLVESELFGHERGAFTGAIQRRYGVFERARGGTVFLDEVGELDPSAQTRLLRVLQTRRFERVGGSETITTDVRLIAATNKDLAAAVGAGAMRADLYYRLNVFPLVMPPLRERGKADLMLLTDAFIDRTSREMGKRIFRIDTPAIDMITAYHWPGNVRELQNVVERAVVLAEGEVIHGHHLPPSLQMNRYATSPENLDFTRRVRHFEIELITEALKDCSGNQTRAAERLGITKRVIQYKIRAYGIPWQRFTPKR